MGCTKAVTKDCAPYCYGLTVIGELDGPNGCFYARPEVMQCAKGGV